MQFYAPYPLDNSALQQGDLLAYVPFTIFSLSQAVATLANGEIATLDLSKTIDNVKYVTAEVEFNWGMILTQTCDMQPDPQTGYSRKLITIARVRPIKDIFPKFKDSSLKESLESVRNLSNPGKSPNVLYLPEHGQDEIVFPKSAADILDLQRFSHQDLKALSSLLKLRLQDTALQALQERCAYCFGRFGAPDNLYYSAEEWAFEEERRKNSN